MNPDLIQEKFETNDRRLNNHGERLKKLENKEAAQAVRIDHLCEKIEKQTKSINALVGLLIAALIGFFFYAIQAQIFYY